MAKTVAVSTARYINYPSGEFSARSITADAVVFDVPTAEGFMRGASIMQNGEKAMLAVVPFLLNARADKPGNYDVTITMKLLDYVAQRIVVFDPHNDPFVIKQGTERDKVWVVTPLDILSVFANPVWDARLQDFTAVVAPDKGAVERAGAVARWLGVPLYTGEKVRDQATGRIVRYQFDAPAGADMSNVLVVDDICDGGGTFALLRDNLPGKATLYVTHGLFTGAAEREYNLSGYDLVVTTDTHPRATTDIGTDKIVLPAVSTFVAYWQQGATQYNY